LGLLAWIAGYKLIKAVIAITGAIILIRLGRQNLVDVAHRWLTALGLDPEGRFGTHVIARVGHFNPQHLHFMVVVFFSYAVLYCAEAVGLLLEKRWAEWLTVVQTLILVPLEVYAIYRHPGPWTFIALSLSVGVVLYLVWRIRADEAKAVNRACNGNG
jgi:uncharacterized membrane protein (DUF2068 family)